MIPLSWKCRNINYRLGECCRYHLQLHGWYYLPDHDQLYIVMEKAECDLLTALRNSGLQSWKRRKEVAIDVAKGLEAVHGVEYVYQDLKPQNVMVTSLNIFLDTVSLPNPTQFSYSHQCSFRPDLRW